jgi:antitoxin StbD
VDYYPSFGRGIMLTKDFLSATALSKKTAATLDLLEKGDTEKLIILKNNSPKAVLLSIDAYDAMQEEIEDLRLASLGFARLKSYRENESISHEEMMKRFRV